MLLVVCRALRVVCWLLRFARCVLCGFHVCYLLFGVGRLLRVVSCVLYSGCRLLVVCCVLCLGIVCRLRCFLFIEFRLLFVVCCCFRVLCVVKWLLCVCCAIVVCCFLCVV